METNAMTDDEPTSKKFNLNTYKAHLLGDYASTIRRLGTTDSYSTVIVSNYPRFVQILKLWAQMQSLQGELEHCRPKARFSHTDKKQFIKQMAWIERREMCIRHIRANLRMPPKVKNSSMTGKALKYHYHIGESKHSYQHIETFLRNNSGDPALKVS